MNAAFYGQSGQVAYEGNPPRGARGGGRSGAQKSQAKPLEKRECNKKGERGYCVEYLEAIFEEVTDGDTFVVTIPSVHELLGKSIPVRVRGIDTPELREHRNNCAQHLPSGTKEEIKSAQEYAVKKAKKAKKRLESFFSGLKRLTLKKIGRGSFFRIVADVEINGELLSQKMLDTGLAIPYKSDAEEIPRGWCIPE